MADNKFPNKLKLDTITTPVGVAVYPHLTKPDTKWKDEGEYRVKLKYNDPKVITPLREKLDKFLDTAFEKYQELLAKSDDKKAKAKLKTLKKADLPLKPEVDDEGEETGAFLLNTKRTASGISKKTGEPWKAKLVFADSLGKTVSTKGLSIWSGSELRVQGTVSAWYGAKDNEVGISIDIDGVQIKKLVSGGGRDVEFDAMDDEDGWTADDSVDGGDTSDTDATDDDAEEDGDDTPNF